MHIKWSEKAYNAAEAASNVDNVITCRQARWDKTHIKSASTRLPTDIEKVFRRICFKNGVTRYRVINYMIRTWIEMMEMENQPHRDETKYQTQEAILESFAPDKTMEEERGMAE